MAKACSNDDLRFSLMFSVVEARAAARRQAATRRRRALLLPPALVAREVSLVEARSDGDLQISLDLQGCNGWPSNVSTWDNSFNAIRRGGNRFNVLDVDNSFGEPHYHA